MNRRHFLKSSLIAGASIATLPSVLTSCASARRVRRPAPNSRINMALIGFGTVAQFTTPNFLGIPQVQVVAVADPITELPNFGYQGELHGGRLVGQRLVNGHYAAAQTSGSYSGCRIYEDYREMLDREDIDAVIISTPDHWHCPITLHAARLGKHIYCQKPLSLTVEEGQRMVKAVREAGIIMQTGSQQRSKSYFKIACEYVRNGRLGKLQRIEIVIPGGHGDFSRLASRTKPEAVPKELNYDLWLGPAPEREYVPALLQVNWRHNFDFSGGMVTDWGAHHLDILQWALGMDESGPVAIENIVATTPPPNALYNTATDFNFDVVYASGLRANVTNNLRNGLLFVGEGGKSIFVSRDELTMTPDSLRKEKIREDEIRLYESLNHEKNFIEHIYDGKPAVAPIHVGHRSILIAHLANIAIRLGRSEIKWDPANERVPGDDKANAMLRRPMRKPYAV
ncbi:MAG: Gfo/Idh/MocA family oxidoreductase [Opitutaceae bacterium]